jgi:hypothetical protein
VLWHWQDLHILNIYFCRNLRFLNHAIIISRFLSSCLGPLLSMLPKTFKYFGFERTRWDLFQKRVMSSKLTYAFISIVNTDKIACLSVLDRYNRLIIYSKCQVNIYRGLLSEIIFSVVKLSVCYLKEARFIQATQWLSRPPYLNYVPKTAPMVVQILLNIIHIIMCNASCVFCMLDHYKTLLQTDVFSIVRVETPLLIRTI